MDSREDTLIKVTVATIVGIAIVQMTVAEMQRRKQQFEAWRTSWLEPFRRHPGRRAFLRDVLVREEMRVKSIPVALAEDCGCDDAN